MNHHLIQEKAQVCKAIFNTIEGAQSFASIESCFYNNVDLQHLFSPLEGSAEIPILVSDMTGINFYEMYAQYHGTRHPLTISALLDEVSKNVQRCWSFHKMFNASQSKDFKQLEIPINLAIAELEESILNELESYQRSEIFHFDAGGYDYALITIEFTEGVQVIEFLWFID